MGGSHRLWARSMDLTVNGEGSSIERPVTDHNFSRVIDTDQVAGLEHRKSKPKGFTQNRSGELRVADGDVPGSALVVAELGEQPEARGQTLLAVEAFVFDGFEGWKQVEGADLGHWIPPGDCGDGVIKDVVIHDSTPRFALAAAPRPTRSNVPQLERPSMDGPHW